MGHMGRLGVSLLCSILLVPVGCDGQESYPDSSTMTDTGIDDGLLSATYRFDTPDEFFDFYNDNYKLYNSQRYLMPLDETGTLDVTYSMNANGFSKDIFESGRLDLPFEEMVQEGVYMYFYVNGVGDAHFPTDSVYLEVEMYPLYKSIGEPSSSAAIETSFIDGEREGYSRLKIQMNSYFAGESEDFSSDLTEDESFLEAISTLRDALSAGVKYTF